MASLDIGAERNRAASIYHEMMTEVKLRIMAINEHLSDIRNCSDQSRAIFHAEFCFLQIRMICEIIALSSLAAHSTIGLSKGALKEWNAERIFADLLKINPHCFPKAVSVDQLDKGVIADIETPTIGLLDLKRIYSGCADMLHRSRGVHIVKRNSKNVDVSSIRMWGNDLVTLLANHMIYVANIETFFLVSLSVPPKGEVQVALAELASEPDVP